MLRFFLSRLRVAILATTGLAACAIEPPAPGAFYDGAVPRAAVPGDLIRAEPIAGAPNGASAFRILYASAGLDGKTRTISGVVFVPAGAPPAGMRNIVAWAHPTTGVATRCAPSLHPPVAASIPGLDRFLTAGWVVVATDYPGLGTKGPHPYLVGISEGRAVLDSVRAAMQLPHTAAGPRFVVWGHSQGGHAALFAGQMARGYAPELRLAGVAAAAPASELGTVLHDDIGSTAGRILTTYALWSWSQLYDLRLASVVAPASIPAMARVAAACAEGLEEALVLEYDAAPLRDRLLTADPATTEPWRTLIGTNNPGRTAIAAPLIIAQGSRDRIVPPAVTQALFKNLCRDGATVRYLALANTGHLTAGKASADAVADWFTDRFAGLAPPDDCPRQ